VIGARWRKADKNPQVPRLTNLREQGEVAQADAAKLPEAKVASSAAKVESAPPAIPPDDAKAAPSGTRAQPEAAGETKAVAAKQARRGPRGEIAGLGFGTHDGDAGTFGAGILVGYRPTGALALAAVFEATGERERTLGPGLAGYRSFRLASGPACSETGAGFSAISGCFRANPAHPQRQATRDRAKRDRLGSGGRPARAPRNRMGPRLRPSCSRA